MMMQRSGIERLKMGCAMFDAARILMRASITAENETEMRVQIFKRTYENDFDPETVAKIVAWIRKNDRPQTIESHETKNHP